MEPLPVTPPSLVRPDGSLLHGLTAGELRADPLVVGPRRRRRRRWYYAAGGDADHAVGAAVVDLGVAAVAFVWANLAGDVLTWEAKAPLGRGAWVGVTPGGGAGFRRGRDRVFVDADGGLDLDVGVGRERLRAHLVARPDTPAVLATPTEAGGWNVTQKEAGYRVEGFVQVGPLRSPIAGGGWRDWTAGRQDRHTVWRWAAGAGTAQGHRIGLNVSTGMNATGPGEDVVWWDGTPYPLTVTTLAPAGEDPRGAWQLDGPGWHLDFTPVGARVGDENLVLMRSWYVQPIGTFAGTLPGPDGEAVSVDTMVGVTEDHEATW